MVVTKRKILRLEERSCVYVTADRSYSRRVKIQIRKHLPGNELDSGKHIFGYCGFFYDLLDEFHGPNSHGGESNDRLKNLAPFDTHHVGTVDACDSRDCGGLSSSLLFVVLRI